MIRSDRNFIANEKVSDWGGFFVSLLFVAALIGFYTLAPWIGLLDASIAPSFSILFRAVVVGTAIFTMTFVQTRRLNGLIVRLFPMVLLLIIYSFRMIDNYFIKDLDIYVDARTSFSFLFGICLLPAVVLALYTPRLRDKHVANSMLIFAIVLVAGFIFNAGTLIDSSLNDNVANRVSLERMNPIALASNAITLLLFFVIFYGIDRKTKLSAMFLVPVFLLLAVYARSRGPIVSTIGALTLFFVVSNRGYRVALLKALFVALTIGVVVNFVFEIDIYTMLTGRFLTGDTSNISNDPTREILWTSAWQEFLDSPFIGRYFFETQLRIYPHNAFLESLISLGVIGGFLFALFTVTSLTASVFVLRSGDASRVAIFTTLIFYKEYFQAMFSGALWGLSSLWVTSAVMIAFAVDLRQKRRNLMRISALQ